MKVHPLTATDGFVVIDLHDSVEAGEAQSVGLVRSAPKILQSGAKELARSLTYTFAVLEQKRSGASAGVNASDRDRPGALQAFVSEIQPMASSGAFLADPGIRVSGDDLIALRAVDPRSAVRFESIDGSSVADHLLGVGAAAAASAALGGDLSGRKIAIEGFGASGPALARQVVDWGGSLVAVSTSAGTALNPEGFDLGTVTHAWSADGAGMIASLGEVEPAWKVFGSPVDVLFTGSKPGALTHQGAEQVTASLVVPSGPIPVTTKAFAMLRRSGVSVLPDFVSAAGPVFAMWPADSEAATPTSVESDAVSTITDLVGELAGHDDGPLLAACYRAEAFLSTWQDKLPFGRPLA